MYKLKGYKVYRKNKTQDHERTQDPGPPYEDLENG